MIDWQAFHFLRPGWLAAGLLCLPWAWLFLRRARRSGAWRRVCDAHLLKHLLVDAGGRARRWPALLGAVVWVAACLALAGPAWQRLPQPSAELAEQRVLVLSLAPSMTARDVAPSRVARGRFALSDALRALPGGQFGLVVYSEEPYAVTPLTDDADVVQAVLPVLDPSIMPGRGARLDRAIDEARRLLEGAGATRGRIVVVADGPGDAPDAARKAAGSAAAAGFQVGVLGIGHGDAAALRAIAEAGGGPFAPVGVGPEATASVVGRAGASPWGAGAPARDDVQVDAWRDAGRALLWLPLVLAPLAFRRGWAGALVLAGLLLVEPGPARASEFADWFARPDQQGARAFAAGENEAAAGLFEDPAWRATALYRGGKYAAAAKALEGRTDPESLYNRGNSLARAGQLEAALTAYEQVLALAPDHADARYNRDLVKKLLEPEKQREQKQQRKPGQQPQSSRFGSSQAGASDGQGSDASRSDAKAGPQDSRTGASGDEAKDGKEGDGKDRDAKGEVGDQKDGKPSGDSGQASPQSVDPSRGENGEQRSAAEAGSGSAADTAVASGPQPRVEAAALPRSETPQGAAAAAERPLSESEQATEQWLRRVPDDPAGLLREKLRRLYAERRYEGGAR